MDYTISNKIILGNTLLNAAEDNDLAKVKEAIQQGAEVDYNYDWKTAMYYAIKNNNREMIDYLLEHGATMYDVDNIKRGEYNPVAIAAQFNNFDLVKYLLSRGGKATYVALLIAIDENNYEIVDYLLQRGVKLKEYDLRRVADKNLRAAEYIIIHSDYTDQEIDTMYIYLSEDKDKDLRGILQDTGKLSLSAYLLGNALRGDIEGIKELDSKYTKDMIIDLLNNQRFKYSDHINKVIQYFIDNHNIDINADVGPKLNEMLKDILKANNNEGSLENLLAYVNILYDYGLDRQRITKTLNKNINLKDLIKKLSHMEYAVKNYKPERITTLNPQIGYYIEDDNENLTELLKILVDNGIDEAKTIKTIKKLVDKTKNSYLKNIYIELLEYVRQLFAEKQKESTAINLLKERQSSGIDYGNELLLAVDSANLKQVKSLVKNKHIDTEELNKTYTRTGQQVIFYMTLLKNYKDILDILNASKVEGEVTNTQLLEVAMSGNLQSVTMLISLGLKPNQEIIQAIETNIAAIPAVLSKYQEIDQYLANAVKNKGEVETTANELDKLRIFLTGGKLAQAERLVRNQGFDAREAIEYVRRQDY